MKVLGISGTIIGAKPVALIDEIVTNLKNKVDWDVDLLNLANYHIDFCDGRQEADYSKDTQTVIQKVKEADAYIIGTPIFNGSFPAPLKNLIDLVSPQHFAEKIMAFAAAAGRAEHHLVVENQLKPIAGYLQAYVAPTYIFALPDSFDRENNVICSETLSNIDKMTDQIMNLGKVVNQERVDAINE